MNHPEVPGITVLGIEGYQTGWGPNAFVQNNFEWRDVASFTRGLAQPESRRQRNSRPGRSRIFQGL